MAYRWDGEAALDPIEELREAEEAVRQAKDDRQKLIAAVNTRLTVNELFTR